MIRKFATALFSTTLSTVCLLDKNEPKAEDRHAICILYPNNSNARGVVGFSQ